MQITVRYISYILAICAVTFSLTFRELTRHKITAPSSEISQIYSSVFPLLAPVKQIRPDISPDIFSVIPLNALSDKDLYPKILSHVVRINNIAGSSVGSGVVIWSGMDAKRVAHTFILTNRHVLLLGLPGTMESFTYLNFRDISSTTTYPCFTVAQDDNADLALVEVISSEVFPTVSPIISSDEYEQMPLYTDLFIVGCGLGNPPFVSPAKVFQFNDLAIMLNGFSVWGFSGGGVFDRCGHLVSISCQIGIAVVGPTTHAITNMSMSIPVNVICKWLLSTKYKFIVDPRLGSIDDIIKPKKFY